MTTSNKGAGKAAIGQIDHVALGVRDMDERIAFLTGTLAVLFYVAYGGFFQTIVRREDYVAANALTRASLYV